MVYPFYVLGKKFLNIMSKRYPSGFISAFYDPLKNPGAPTIGTATSGDATASVPFTAPPNVGGSAITSYVLQSTPGKIISSNTTSPISVTGLTNDTAYTFAVWALNSYGPSAFSASSNSVTPAQLFRGVFAGGSSNIIDYISIPSTGNATDFGDLLSSQSYQSGFGSTTRGVFAGGSNTNVIQYITIASTGNATDFGDITVNRQGSAGASSSTRGLVAGGVMTDSPYFRYNIIDYVTIASVGNAIDFGDMTNTSEGPMACSSPTRGVFAGGYNGSSRLTTIDYVTIASAGNATNFGSLTSPTATGAGCSSSTRGIFGGGYDGNAANGTNVIEYVTIASTGNATDFGDLSDILNFLTACSSQIRAVFGGGFSYNTFTSFNVLQYITISSTGNTTDFGDLTRATNALTSCSNCSGGVQ